MTSSSEGVFPQEHNRTGNMFFLSSGRNYSTLEFPTPDPLT